MEIRVLGPLEVVDGDRAVALPRGRIRALLALLALRAGEVVSAERLIDQLWGEVPPPTAHKALHGLVSTLRRQLADRPGEREAPSLLDTRSPGYVLAIDRDRIDAHRFRRLVADAANARAPSKAVLLRDALGLWRGAALEEFVYEPFAQAAIADLEELRLAALQDRIEADLALGRHAEVLAELERLVTEHPVRERLHGQLMLARYRCGRQAEALDAYRRARDHLVDELGIEPGPALRALERAILDQDPSLAAPAGQAEAVDSARDEEAAQWFTTGRKTVTVLYADLSPSLSMSDRGGADPESVRPAVKRAYDVAVAALERHGGSLEGFIGNVVVAVFGIPVTHEDDALRAVRASLELREQLAALNVEVGRELGVRLAARIGITTGEIVVGDPRSGQSATSGAPVAVAARLQQVAADGEVLMGAPTRRLVGDAVVVEPAGIAAADRRGDDAAVAWRLVDLVPQPSPRGPVDAPLVGREAELGHLRSAFERALRERCAVLVAILGDAGVGKSRLASEFVHTVRPGARVVTGHCPAYGDGLTFWPLREIVRELIGESEIDRLTELVAGEVHAASTAAQVADAVGMSEQTGRPGEVFPAVRRLVEAVTRRQPLVVVVEDLHWAQPTFLDLVEYLGASTRGPVLLLCLARPELGESRPGWAYDALQPLDRHHSEQLLAHRLRGRPLPAGTVERVLAMAQGNPLFLEQMLATLRDDVDAEIPPTVQALLTARLDRLGPAERDLLRCASVVGTEFPVDALSALLPDRARPPLDRHLRSLQAKALLGPEKRSPDGAARYRFQHALVRLAAYGSLTRQARAELHERFADWLEHSMGSRLVEIEELLGHHLEQAVLHRRDLGRFDAAGRGLAVRAGERLAGAGLRAYGRFDLPAAQNLLSRAKPLLPQDHPQRPAVLRRLAETYPPLGRPAEADAAFAELLDEVGADANTRFARGIRLERTRIRLITGPDPVSLAAIRREADAALSAFREAGDEVGMSQAHYVLAFAHLRAGRVAELAETARRGLEHAERSGDLRERLGAPWWVMDALVTGPTPVPECIRAGTKLIVVGGIEHVGVLADLGRLRAMLGEIDEARGLISRARRVIRERLPLPRPQTSVAQCAADVEVLAGDLAAAEVQLRPALDLAVGMSERDQVAQIAAELSILCSRQGRLDDAALLATLARQNAPAESVTAQALTRAAMARVALSQDDAVRAEHLCRQAVQLVPIDMLNLRARLHVELAETMIAAAQDPVGPSVLSVLSDGVDLYRRKGNLVAAGQARALFERAGGGDAGGHQRGPRDHGPGR